MRVIEAVGAIFAAALSLAGCGSAPVARLKYLQGFRAPFGDGYDHLVGVYLLRLSSDWTQQKQ